MKLNGQIVCNKNLNGGNNREIIKTQLRIPTDDNTVKVRAYFHHCTGNSRSYKSYIYNYCGGSIFSDGSDFEGNYNGSCGKEGDVEISRLLLTFKDKQILRFYMKVY